MSHRRYVCIPAFLLFGLASGVPLTAASSNIVISQIYGGGGNSGATLKNDFIELFNRGTTTVDVTGWTIQYSPALETTWDSTVLSGSIAPGHFYLIKEAQGNGGTIDLPTEDAKGGIKLNLASAKIALVSSATLLSGICPSSTTIVDFVGYGTGVSCAEGNPAPTLANTTAALRVGGGCIDTDNNSADFTEGAPNPRNSSFSFAACGTTPDTGIEIIFPQIADGGSYRTFLLLTNSSSVGTTAGVHFYRDNGDAFALTINGQTASDFMVPVPAQGSVKLMTSGQSPTTTVGWARVTASSSSGLNGNAIFQSFVGSNLFCEASVPPSPAIRSADFFADEHEDFITGFAIVNPTTTAVQVTAALKDMNGAVVGTYSFELGPGQHVARFLYEIFGTVPHSIPSGRAQFDAANGFISVIAIRFHTSWIYSTLSVGQPGFSASGATAMFSPNGGVRDRLVAELNKAQSSIDIAIYSFTADAIRDALIAARSRGVQIRVIADDSQSSGQGSEVSTLEALGFNLKRMSGPGGIMHNKYMIIDGSVLVTGSYNWSAAAEDSNFENAVFIQGSATIQEFVDDFNKIWGK